MHIICNISSLVVAQPVTYAPRLQGLVVDVTSHDEAPSCSGTLKSVSEEIGIDEEQVLWLSQLRPELLHRPTTRLKKRLEGLADLLGCTVKQSASMVQKQSALLDLDSDTIRRKLTELTKALGNDRKRACATARRIPVLLVSNHVEGLSGHMIRLAPVFSMHSMQDVLHLSCKEPLLLVMEAEEVQRRLEGVARCLHLSDSLQEAVSICRSHPFLLTVTSSSLNSKVQTLESALHFSHSVALQLVRSYPPILSYSESSILNKVAVLSEVFPRHRLKSMVFREPTLLTRSSSKMLQSFRSAQETVGISTQATVDIVERRPGILTKSPEAPSRSYRALSIWKLNKEEKREMIEAHPLLLQLSSRELHFRCRWLRQLIKSNGFFHSAARRIPFSLLGVIILHLPTTWSRLQYLAESSQESKVQLTDALKMKSSTFDAKFPQYKKWLHYTTSEMGRKVPWRRPGRSTRGQEQQQRLDADNHSAATTSNSGAEASTSPRSWHDAGSRSDAGLYQQIIVSKAQTVYYGMVPVCKPQRVVYTSDPGPGPSSSPCPEPSHQASAASQGTPEEMNATRGISRQMETLNGCTETIDGDSWELGNVS